MSALNAVALQDHLMRQLSLENIKGTHIKSTAPCRRTSRITSEVAKTGEIPDGILSSMNLGLNFHAGGK